jgi:hypothetical protein
MFIRSTLDAQARNPIERQELTDEADVRRLRPSGSHHRADGSGREGTSEHRAARRQPTVEAVKWAQRYPGVYAAGENGPEMPATL